MTRADWVAGAWEFIAEHGVPQLAIEPLAAHLGTTKGSFYWHFADRAALLDAVLADWVERATTEVIAEVDAEPDDERLAALLGVALTDRSVSNAAEWALLAAVDDPRVGPVVAEVHRLRTDYLRQLFLRRGLSARRADARAGICYAAYLGTLQLSRGTQPGASGGSIPLAGKDYRAELLRMIGNE